MDDLKTLYYQLMAATSRCREDGYSLASVNVALDRAARYYEALPDEEGMRDQRYAVRELLASLYNKRELARQSEPVPSGGSKTRVELDILCPVVPSADLAAPMLSVSNVIESNVSRLYRDNALILCGPLMDELVFESRNFARGRSMGFCLVDMEGLLKAGTLSKALKLLQMYYSLTSTSMAVKDVIAYKGIECLAGKEHETEAYAFARALRQLRLKGKGCVQLLLSSDPAYYFNDFYAKAFSGSSKPCNILDDDVSTKALSFQYLPLPACADVIKTVFSCFGIKASPDVPHAWPGTSGDGEDTDAGTGVPGTGEAGDAPAGDEAYVLKRFIKAKCAPLACGALQGILKRSPAPADFKEKAVKAAKERKSMLDTFFANSGYTVFAAVVDKEWGYSRPEMKKRRPAEPGPAVPPAPGKYKYTMPATQYDYDAIDSLATIRKCVKQAMEADFDAYGDPLNVRQKCGLVIRQALTGGNAMNLENVTSENEEEMKARWTLAYAALTQLMQIPSGSLVFDLPERGDLNGQCDDGGKTIRLNKKFAKDASCAAEGCTTLLHELFHAVQYSALAAYAKVENNPSADYAATSLLAYYKDNFGITEQRIYEAWRDNQTRGYVDSSKSYDLYHVQVFEADARVFADETWEAAEDVSLARED